MIIMVRKINNDKDLLLAVIETRQIIKENDGENSSLLKYCTVEAVKEEHARDNSFTLEDVLQDLIWESWGEDC